MGKVRHIAQSSPLPEWFLDALQEFISTQASPNFIISQLNSTTLRIVAATNNDQVAIAITKAGVTGWRYITATITGAAPGGLAVGDHDVYVTSYANGPYVNQTGPPSERDDTNYAFGLKLVAAGTTPSGAGGSSEEFYRLVGHFTWDGAQITDFRQIVGGGSLPKHAAQHLAGAGDALAWTTITGKGTLAARPAAGATNAGYTYLATDVNGGTTYRSDGSTWTQQSKGVTEAPGTHAASHAPAGTDALPWGTIHGYGTLASRPAAASTNVGYTYYATDTTTLYRSNGTTWDSMGAAPPSNTAIAGAILLSGTLASRPAAAAGNASFYYYVTDLNGGTLQQSNGSSWSTLLQSAITTDAPKKLYQGQLAAAAATVYTVPTAKQTRYETARFFNNDSVARTVTVYDGGTAAANTILPATEIAAGDWIEIDMAGMGGQATGTIAAVASAAGVVTMTLYGSEEDVGQRLYKKLYQGTPGNAMATVLTAGARERLTHVRAVNTHATSTLGLGLADGGTGPANVLQAASSPSSQIPPGGVMEIQSYLALANAVTLAAQAAGSGTDVVLTVYGIEG